MKTYDIFLNAESVTGKFLTPALLPVMNFYPVFTAGMRAKICLHLHDSLKNELPVTSSVFKFVVDIDYSSATTPVILQNSGFTVTGNKIYFEVDFNTTQLLAALGSLENKIFFCELSGHADGETLPDFVLQFPIKMQNRLVADGTPTGVASDYYTATQVNALLAAGFSVQFSSDATSWHTSQTAADTFFRFKAAGNLSQTWSGAIQLLKGADGTDGTNGTNGVTPHIDATTNHWFLGATDTGVLASDNLLTLWQTADAFFTYDDETFGMCSRLDDTVNKIDFANIFDNLTFLRLKVQSASATIGGNISLNVTLTNGTATETKTFTVPVTTAQVWQTLDLSTMTQKSGRLEIVRATGAAADTLKEDTTVITAVVTAIRYKEQ